MLQFSSHTNLHMLISQRPLEVLSIHAQKNREPLSFSITFLTKQNLAKIEKQRNANYTISEKATKN